MIDSMGGEEGKIGREGRLSKVCRMVVFLKTTEGWWVLGVHS